MNRQSFYCRSLLLVRFLIGAAAVLGSGSFFQRCRAAEVDFRRDIRPILSDKCYACHGPDEEQRQGALRLDTREGAFTDLGGYAAIKSGEPDSSALIQKVLSTDPDEQMPPSDHVKQLSEKEKRLLVRWVSEGAAWSEHWAYVPPRRHEVPEVKASKWPRRFVDHFVLENLQAQGLAPSPDADKGTLIRRLHFDLVGLPPSPEEVDAFVESSSPEAYEDAVDRLLRSSHFGERLAVYWLDLVRYADTVGYHGDQDVSISPYRDYVINAFNSNKSFDQFTVEQLAGDLLENATQEQLIASGYNRLGMMSAEGGVQPEEYLAKYAADRVRTAAAVWLGSTMGCAECHDHKFDPFSTRDFYRFAAFFADIKERGLYSGANRDGQWGPMIDVQDSNLPQLLEPLDSQIAQLKKRLVTPTDALHQSQAQWEEAQLRSLQQWRAVNPESASGTGDVNLAIQDDHSILASGNLPERTVYTVSASLGSESLTAICLEVLPHDSLPEKGPGRAGNGNFVVTELEAVLVGTDGDRHELSFSDAFASVEQEDSKKNPYGKWSAEAAIDQDSKGGSWGWAILPEAGKPNCLVAVLKEPVQPQGRQLELTIQQNHENPKHSLGRFRILTSSTAEPAAGALPSDLPLAHRPILRLDAQNRTKGEELVLQQYYLTVAPELDSVRNQLAQLEERHRELKSRHTRTTLVTVSVDPREMRVLNRGNWMDKTGEVVSPGVPLFLKQLSGSDPAQSQRATRLDLAKWIVSKDNPLTARVFVNRLWKLFLGMGLSESLDDFGSQGEPPVYPELLDTLAVEFVESGWDIKHMIKIIVMSSTYRQSSLVREEFRETDPFNRLFARQSRYRLDAEFVRDNALAVSGLLVRKIGGRSVKPYQPVGLYRHLNFPKREYKQDGGENQYRRGLYTHWQRQFLHPALQAMDAPAREECTAKRPRSNTPLAALVLLNDPSFVEASRNLAEKALANSSHYEDRMAWLGKRVLSRQLSARENVVLKALLENHLEQYESSPEEADALVGIGLSKPADEVGTVELAAWTSVTRAILNMHEVTTRN